MNDLHLVILFFVSVSVFRTQVSRRPSCLMWSVKFTLPQTAVQWTCRHMNCVVTWSMWSLTSPASMGKQMDTLNKPQYHQPIKGIIQTSVMSQNLKHCCSSIRKSVVDFLNVKRMELMIKWKVIVVGLQYHVSHIFASIWRWQQRNAVRNNTYYVIFQCTN